ncbi:PLP-dependent aminotransferase family protein [Cereibacter sphaeroides]|nr:PLP-dependent aminotransferase family protein [Cereibacter sphaeroides]
MGQSDASRLGARAIYESLRDQIRAGTYATGAALPSSRGLAVELGVSRGTVSSAIEQLAAEGFVEVSQGARPRVAPLPVASNPSPEPATPAAPPRLSPYGQALSALPSWRDYQPSRAPYAFRYGDLSPGDFPAQAWKRAIGTELARRPTRLAYEDPRGSLRLRRALQGYLWRARTLRCEAGQILIVNGSQQGLDLCARLLLGPGDRFVIEEPGYRMARMVFGATGAQALPVPVDADGMRTEGLAGLDARLAYLTPSHQFPLGGVMPVGRRQQLLDWARAQDAVVIEDDYDSEYRYDIRPVPPLHGLDTRARVIYLGTISKTLSPTMRLGYLVVPPELVHAFVTAKQFADRHTSLLEQEALASLIEDGGYERHIRRVRRANAQRRAALLQALTEVFGDRVEVEGAQAGLHLVVWFRDLHPDQRDTVIAQALARGVGLYPVDPHYAAPEGPQRAGFLMGYASLDPARIAKGIRLLGEVLAQLDQHTGA